MGRVATRQRFEECHEFAHSFGAREIIFLSSYLPIINLSFYDKGWVEQSVTFWRAYLDASGAEIAISVGNTFEYHPDLMLRVVEEVNRPNFRMTFLAGTRPSPPTPDRTKSLDDSPSHDRLETDSHSIRSFALLF
jgi:hypothetical protein